MPYVSDEEYAELQRLKDQGPELEPNTDEWWAARNKALAEASSEKAVFEVLERFPHPGQVAADEREQERGQKEEISAAERQVLLDEAESPEQVAAILERYAVSEEAMSTYQ